MRSSFFQEQSGREGNIKAIRQGEIAGAVTTLLQGAAAARLVDSWLPLLGAIAVSAIMIGGYEWSIAHPSSEEGMDDNPLAAAMQWRAA